jgi:hypothetical protein
MEKMVNEYQDLDQEQNEGNIRINSNYYSFLLLFGLVIFIVIILTKFTIFSGSSSFGANNYFQSGGQLGEINVYYIIFAIILLAIFIYYYWFIYMYTSWVISTIVSFFPTIII